MRKLLLAISALAATWGLGAAATKALAPDPWAGEWNGAALKANGGAVDVTVRVDARGGAALRMPGCETELAFQRWGAPGRIYQASDAGACAATAPIRLVIGADGVMRMRPLRAQDTGAVYAALRPRSGPTPPVAAFPPAPAAQPPAAPARRDPVGPIAVAPAPVQTAALTPPLAAPAEAPFVARIAPQPDAAPAERAAPMPTRPPEQPAMFAHMIEAEPLEPTAPLPGFADLAWDTPATRGAPLFPMGAFSAHEVGGVRLATLTAPAVIRAPKANYAIAIDDEPALLGGLN